MGHESRTRRDRRLERVHSALRAAEQDLTDSARDYRILAPGASKREQLRLWGEVKFFSRLTQELTHRYNLLGLGGTA